MHEITIAKMFVYPENSLNLLIQRLTLDVLAQVMIGSLALEIRLYGYALHHSDQVHVKKDDQI